MFALAERLDREAGALFKEVLEDFLSRYESKIFGGLTATQKSGDEERQLLHARILSKSVAKRLCGASDGPWSARGFDFLRSTCHECKSIVLDADQPSE